MLSFYLNTVIPSQTRIPFLTLPLISEAWPAGGWLEAAWAGACVPPPPLHPTSPPLSHAPHHGPAPRPSPPIPPDCRSSAAFAPSSLAPPPRSPHVWWSAVCAMGRWGVAVHVGLARRAGRTRSSPCRCPTYPTQTQYSTPHHVGISRRYTIIH